VSDEEPDNSSSGPTPSTPDLPGLAAFVALGSTLAACVAVGVVAGIAADDAWHISPWGLLVGLVLGVAAAVMSVLKLVQRWL
jgi:F0F1-type ATP synthase assembly protein I